MYWQFFGIRRTPLERAQVQRLEDASAGRSSRYQYTDTDTDLAARVESTPAEEADMSQSPQYRTIVLPPHGSQYPITRDSIEGVAIAFDDDKNIYELRIGDRFNRINPMGADGEEMFDAFWYHHNAIYTVSTIGAQTNLLSPHDFFSFAFVLL